MMLFQCYEHICCVTHHFDELKELYDGRVEEVVSGAVVQQGINDGLKQVPFDDVAVVVLVLQTNDPAHETQGTLGKSRQLSHNGRG